MFSVASWREFAPDATFANLTLVQFEVELQKALDVRTRMAALQTQLKGMKIERDQADEVQSKLFVSVSNSIRGNPDFEMNSPLYRSLGFVTKVGRKRAKNERTKRTPPPHRWIQTPEQTLFDQRPSKSLVKLRRFSVSVIGRRCARAGG